ncbi:DNA polymerase II [soil metagenome]
MNETRTIDAVLLSREWRDEADGIEIVLWGRSAEGPVRVRIPKQEAVFFVARNAVTRAGCRVERPLVTLAGDPVDVVYFRSRRRMLEERDRLRLDALVPAFESDVKPSDRYVMERFVTGSFRVTGICTERDGVLHVERAKITRADARVGLSMLSIDIETDGFEGPILSAALADREHEEVFGGKDERALLGLFFAAIVARDPDVICGWNVVEFDLTVLQARARKLGVPFAIGRSGERGRILPGNVSIARIPGRVVLDGIATLKSATYDFERFTLEYVAQAVLGRGKRIDASSDKLAEIRRMHVEDPEALADYNLEDCRLVLDVFEKTDLLAFALARARLTGLPMDRQGGSVAAFDHVYLPRLHRRGVVAPDVDRDVLMIQSPGGHVLESAPGLYRDVLSFDFRSLYPSIIRTFQIDPLAMAQPGDDPIPGEDGATFAREGAILPTLITTLHDARSVAMAEENAALSRAIKILMNSFYGVLGTPGCRFFDPKLPTSITRRGHAIIKRACAFFEARDLKVIYGDTDSLFVHFARAEVDLRARGTALARELTALLGQEIARDFRVESHLELRFESHYESFLMPTTRGADRGSKKRYAGRVRAADGTSKLVIRGLEAVRRDWTPFARRVQRELFRRVFEGESYAPWLIELARGLAAGRYDDELVYRKRLRRDLDAYAKDGAPPHVQAARMLDSEPTDVAYVVTTRGPEPLEKRTAPIDYGHYLEKQLAPVCDVILPLIGTSFEKLAGSQRQLF